MKQKFTSSVISIFRFSIVSYADEATQAQAMEFGLMFGV
jgi:hypothetical protein